MIERCRGERGGRDPHWRIALAAPDGGDVEGALARVGRAPLPPYVERDPRDARRRERDRLDYQTVYARAPGAIAAPTAGLHLTEDLLARLLARGVGIARVTLHVGEGTFLPVEAEEIEDHQMHAESFELPAGTAEEIGRCRRGGGRVVAVGTTSARVLETCAREDGTVEARAGLTELFLRPGSRLRVVDALLTNFHLPRSTLLMLVAACAGLERTRALYRHALEAGYRFYSFGDAMLLIGMRHRDSSGAVGPCS
jgi:S-adenosylmethionine:tRNA ribosyltransferase-isomerase